MRGLKVGAPVDLRGIEVGSVTDVALEYDRETKDVKIPVLIEIEPERVHRMGNVADPRAAIAALVEDGMRAQLKTGSLLTGQLFIDLEFHDDVPVKLVVAGEPPELPTLPGGVEAILADVATIVDNISKLPLDRIVKDADTAIQRVNDLLGTLNVEINPILTDADRVLKQAEKALITVNDLIGEDSPIPYDLANALEELSGAARSVRVLSAYLERHPEALLHGKGGPGS